MYILLDVILLDILICRFIRLKFLRNNPLDKNGNICYTNNTKLIEGDKMLKTPKYGWSEITIGDWHDRCSYLDDVPYRLLEAVDYTNRCGRPSSVKFDAEGWDYIIVFDQFETHIICYNFEGEYNYYTIDINLKGLII